MGEKISWSEFEQVDVRVGEIVRVEPFPRARRPAYRLWVDLGPQLGIRQSSAQLTECYLASDLVGRQVLAVVNLAPRNIAGFVSEILVLGLYSEQGVVLVVPERKTENGARLG